jgi:ribonuclease E
MSKIILIDAVHSEETRVAVLKNKKLHEYDYEISNKPQLKGNIYLAKITRIEPSLQAAFIDYGEDKHGFLPFAEIHPSYFNNSVVEKTKKEQEKRVEEINEHFIEISPPDLSDINEAEEKEALLKSRTKEANIEHDVDEPALEVAKEEIEELDEPADKDAQITRNLYRQYKIQEVLKKNQIILVQVVKEERGNKGASFTSYISLAGRYAVLMPNSDGQGGVCRKISSAEKRKYLKQTIDELKIPAGISVIIRTAGEDHTKAEIKRDYDYLVRLWNSIRESTIASKGPTFIHAESDVIKRTVRDTFDDETKDVYVSGENAYNVAVDFAKKLSPGIEKNIKLFKSKMPIFNKFGIESQISSFFATVYHLSSGGYLVINTTEALTTIDVNSGKSTSERNIEETAYKTNLEAAREIAQQIRLRDISGLLVIDFIDMVEPQHRAHVEKQFRGYLGSDKARIQMSQISEFGLIEMSRQRLRSSFLETNTIICNSCAGKGRVREAGTNALTILRTLENEICEEKFEKVIVYANLKTTLYLLNHKRAVISELEAKYNIEILILHEENISEDAYSIETFEKDKKKDSLVKKPTVDEEEIIFDDLEEYESAEDDLFVSDEDNKVGIARSKRGVSSNKHKRLPYKNNHNPNYNSNNNPNSNPNSNPNGNPNNQFQKKHRKRINYNKAKPDAAAPASGAKSWWQKIFN